MEAVLEITGETRSCEVTTGKWVLGVLAVLGVGLMVMVLAVTWVNLGAFMIPSAIGAVGIGVGAVWRQLGR